MVLISGIWPPAVTSSSLSPSRRLGKHYTHPTAKATQPKTREPRTETLGLPRFLGPPRRSTETTRTRTSFMDRVTVRHGALSRPPPAPRTRCPPPTHRSSDCRPAASRPRAAMNHSLHKLQPPQTTASTNHNPQSAREDCTVKFLTEAPRAALPGLPRHRQPRALPRAGQRNVRDEGPPGWIRGPGPAHQLAPRPGPANQLAPEPWPAVGAEAGTSAGRQLADGSGFKRLGPRRMCRGPGGGCGWWLKCGRAPTMTGSGLST